jgi:hypothetical protein
LIDYLSSFFAAISYPGQEWKTRQSSISFFPRLLFMHLGRDMWKEKHMKKDYLHVAFPVILDLTQYTFGRGICPQYQLGPVISHLSHPSQDREHFVAFLSLSKHWMRLNDTEVEQRSKTTSRE